LARFTLIITVTPFTQDLSLQCLIGLLMLFPLRIEFENIEALLNIDFVIETRAVSNLILFFNKIKFFLDCGVVLVTIFSDLEEHFDHILDSLLDIRLVEDISELVKYGHCNWSTHLFQMLSDFACKTDRHLHTVIGGLMQQK